MFQLKTIHPDAIDRALSKVERYRLLNEPREAESICRDILGVVPDHQEALVGLLLSITDQFGRQPDARPGEAREILAKLENDYARAYYAGVIAERWGKARFTGGDPGHVAYQWFAEAMSCYEKAEQLSPPGNDDAILRWNTCARILERTPQIRPRPQEEPLEHGFHDIMPQA